MTTMPQPTERCTWVRLTTPKDIDRHQLPEYLPPTMEEIDEAAADVQRAIADLDAVVMGAYLGRLRTLAATIREQVIEAKCAVDPRVGFSPAGQPWHGHFGVLLLEDEVRDAYMLAREADLLARVCRERMARPLVERFRQEGDLPADLAAEAEAVHEEWEYWEANPVPWEIPILPPGDRYAGEAAREG